MEGLLVCPVFTRLTAHQIVVHEGCFKEKSCHKKLPRLGFPQLHPQAYDSRGAMFNKCIIERRKSLFVINEIRPEVYANVSTCLFSCIFSTFCENLRNFWTNNYFHIKLGSLMSNYLLYKIWKSERRIYIFGRVIEISLGGYFFLLTLYFLIFKLRD